MEDQQILEQQKAYYRARAREYDEWFLRKGRYDRGPAHREQWFREVEEIEAALRPVVRDAEVLELACGTGLWTRQLSESSSRVVAVDASAETIAVNRERVADAKVEYEVADLFAWTPSGRFDVVFFSFWLSHVPLGRFDAFWELVRAALKPGGRVFFIDSLREPTSTAQDHGPLDQSGISRRKLNDGREFDIVKVFYEPAGLKRQMAERGWPGWVRSTETFFLYGSMVAVSTVESESTLAR